MLARHRMTRIAGAAIIVLALGACHSGSASAVRSIPDGCYYVDKTPVFKIAGGQGQMIVPGPVRHFQVALIDNGAKAAFTPPFLFDGSGRDTVTTTFDDGVKTFAFPMVAGAAAPTIHMNMAAYGEVDVARGPGC